MKEHLADFLVDQTGYRISDDYLIRPDDSIVGKLQDDRWILNPTHPELIMYGLYSGRGNPSILCKDPTNPGSL